MRGGTFGAGGLRGGTSDVGGLRGGISGAEWLRGSPFGAGVGDPSGAVAFVLLLDRGMDNNHLTKITSKVKTSFKKTVHDCGVAYVKEQWGSEIRKHLKSGLFEGWISIGPVLKWLGFSFSPNHSKTGIIEIQPSKSLDFKWLPFVRISNGWASGFHIPLKIRTSGSPTSF